MKILLMEKYYGQKMPRKKVPKRKMKNKQTKTSK